MNTKKCSKCGEVKPLDEFYKRKGAKDGYRGQCKSCILKLGRRYRLSNIEKERRRSKDYYACNKDVVNKRVKTYRDKKNNENLIYIYRKLFIEADAILEAAGKKFCCKCNKLKSLSEFQKRSDRKNKYRAECKTCNTPFQETYRIDKALYAIHKNKLTTTEAPRLSKDGVSLEVKCRYCGKYFIPTNSQVCNRVSAINSTVGGRALYCSKHCKTACPVYGQQLYPKTYKKASSREVQPQLRQIVLERDYYTCQKCGSGAEDAQLHCHHILPLNESPIESADIGNCITLCKGCHKEAHELPDCGYHALQC